MNAERLHTAIRATRALFIVRRAVPCDIVALVDAAVEGGAQLVEITLNTPGALAAIRSCSGRFGPDVYIGAGTVCTAEEVALVAGNGGAFVVSPIVEPTMIAAARMRGLVPFPGAVTPTEIWQAARAGAYYVKLFPVTSPEQVRALRGPFPELSLVAVGGVSARNAADYLRAGCVAVGVGGSLFGPADTAVNASAITSGVRAVLAACIV